MSSYLDLFGEYCDLAKKRQNTRNEVKVAVDRGEELWLRDNARGANETIFDCTNKLDKIRGDMAKCFPGEWDEAAREIWTTPEDSPCYASRINLLRRRAEIHKYFTGEDMVDVIASRLVYLQEAASKKTAEYAITSKIYTALTGESIPE